MKQNATYLRVTIHDNDFTIPLEFVGELLNQLFYFYRKYPTEKDFPALKKMIKHIWYGVSNIEDMIGAPEYNFPNYQENKLEWFEPTLEFVDYLDIPDWDNNESIYIPMFDGDVITR